MAKTFSTMQELGTKAPDFHLPDTDGRMVSYQGIAGPKGTLVMFICNHCPYVIHIRKTLAAVTAEYMDHGIGVVAINSNDAAEYPADSPEKMQLERQIGHYKFPYLYDESQEVARTYLAACTPDFFLYDKNRKLVYRGQMDGSRPGNSVVNDAVDLRAAMDALIENTDISPMQAPSMGCNIKWKKA
jgi:peroxiredoxin